MTDQPTPDEIRFVQQHLSEEPAALALQLRRYPKLDAIRVLRQVAGFREMAKKVPSWASCEGLVFPERLSLEQCSSEPTAAYKAALVDRIGGIHQCADLTGGFGVDFAFLAKGKDKACYVERQKALCDLAEHNFNALGLTRAEVFRGDGLHWLKTRHEKWDLLFLDPARRDAHGGKVVAVSDCEPDVATVLPLLLSKSRWLLVKLSPMLDIRMALSQLPSTEEVHVVSVDGECKELLFLLSAKPSLQPLMLHCVNLRSNAPDQYYAFTYEAEQEAVVAYTNAPSGYLYEPNASVLKAGAFNVTALEFGLQKLHPNSHLYVSDALHMSFPGRIFVLEAVFPVHPKQLKERLGGELRANLTVRNFPQTVAELRKRSGLKEGGSVYLFATTLSDEKKVFLKCRKV
jgi:hypothetical protein